MSRTRVMESRPLDARYDPNYIGPFTQVRMDPRVMAQVSQQGTVAGTTRFKYFRRPVMPRMSAIPPSVLLAPTVAATDPSVPLEDVPEPPQKTQEVQTMYRESEAQTTPYTPDYVVHDGEDPDVLMLKNLSFENGLPLSKKDLDMVFNAREKRDLESHLPPFTDEASMSLRKRLMEQQEMREFKLRESEIDRRREERLEELQNALDSREKSNELVSSQRVEAIRQTRMEDREVALQKIRNKRIKSLRRLARKRNAQDPVMAKTVGDTIESYYDKASEFYAPIQRKGKAPGHDATLFDVGARTAPLDSLGKIAELEEAVPKSLREHFSRTEPLGINPRIRAAEPRLTSAAQRSLRDTKRDVEEMHRILTAKKKEQTLALHAQQQSRQAARMGTAQSQSQSAPSSPAKTPSTPSPTACILLQRLIRGRSVQNVMYEGRIRRRELIRELRKADEFAAAAAQETAVGVANEAKAIREKEAKDATLDNIIGGASSNIMSLLNQESQRAEVFNDLVENSKVAELQRQQLEYAEAGRRQKENMQYPVPKGAATG
eukprot:GSChrysophyteH1.ASY1.ANO1.1050.1 assembled CDS